MQPGVKHSLDIRTSRAVCALVFFLALMFIGVSYIFYKGDILSPQGCWRGGVWLSCCLQASQFLLQIKTWLGVGGGVAGEALFIHTLCNLSSALINAFVIFSPRCVGIWREIFCFNVEKEITFGIAVEWSHQVESPEFANRKSAWEPKLTVSDCQIDVIPVAPMFLPGKPQRSQSG